MEISPDSLKFHTVYRMLPIFNVRQGPIYRRIDIHDLYGLNRQSGISPSAKTSYIFILTGANSVQHGYKDEWRFLPNEYDLRNDP